jgi:ABC-2 type transport system permease protein
MSKIALIIQREYMIRVKKKSFIVMTILGPVLFAAVMILPAWLAVQDMTENHVLVLDQSGQFQGKFRSGKGMNFEYVNGKSGEQEKAALREKGEHHFLLIIGKQEGKPTPPARIFGESNPPLEVISSVEKQMNDELRNRQLRDSGIDPKLVESIKPDVEVQSSVLSDEGEKEGGSLAATIVGYGAGFLIYIFIFLYGSQIMMSVMEEKSGRIVELLVSSVKPFELMMGKILGVALVGLTQFLLWMVLSFTVSTVAGKVFIDKVPKETVQQQIPGEDGQVVQRKMESKGMSVLSQLRNVNIATVAVCFIVFFLGGYLMYSAMFAAIGSAIESQQEAQQFMLPVTIPIILSIILAQFVIKDPNGSLSFWLSIFPLTSPIIMMVRVPFEPPIWQIALSMVMLVLGFFGMVWVAGKIFRTGILMYGKKVTWTELGKWLRHS